MYKKKSMNAHFELIADNLNLDNYGGNVYSLHENFRSDIIKNINNLPLESKTKFLIWFRDQKISSDKHTDDFVLVAKNILNATLETL